MYQNNKKTNIMTLTAKQIRTLNIKENDVLGYEYIWMNNEDKYFLTVNGHRVVVFSNPKDRKKSYDKIKRMNLGLGWLKPQLTDEELGIIQAHENGENPFAYSIMCADSSRNEIVK